MNIRKIINIVESENSLPSDQLIGVIRVEGRIGEPLVFQNLELRNQVIGSGDYGWNVERKITSSKKEKWQPFFLSPLRLGKPDFSFDPRNDNFGGQIIFFEKDRATAEAALHAKCKEVFQERINILNSSMKSIP